MSSNIMEQKLKRGYRVEILSRNPPNGNIGEYYSWDNGRVGCEAIVQFSNIEHISRCDVEHMRLWNCDMSHPFYYLLIINPLDTYTSAGWYEEKFLGIICSNEQKGEKIIAEFMRR